MSDTKPLPVAPSIEFERKEAKALLRALHASDPIALSRANAQSSAIGMTSPQALKLSHAQLVIAREYGFTSWPRMVHYFDGLNRLRNRTPSSMNAGLWSPDALERSVFDLISAHGKRRQDAGRKVASYVPRYYGMRADEVFGVPLTEGEARTVVARSSGFPTFAELIAASRYASTLHNGSLTRNARERACEIMRAGDVGALQRLTEAYPELLQPTAQEWRVRTHVLADALSIERETGLPGLRTIADWLGTVGFDVQRELNLNLCGDMYGSSSDVHYWLERGAEPHWIAPNGYSVLEHAILRYWNGDAVDAIAARVRRPKPALWIAAGLGDIGTVSTFLGESGAPTHAVRGNRPDASSMGALLSIQGPGATDEELLLEVLYIAALNGRANVIEYLASRGAPIDSTLFGMPLISVAVGNRWVKVVEALVRGGANLDVRGSQNGSAREMARDLLRSMPDDADLRHVASLVGVDATTVIAEHAQRETIAPSFHPKMYDALALAADDAARVGLAAVSPENLLFGVFRSVGSLLHSYTRTTKLDLDRFRADFAERIRAADDRLDNVALPLRADGQRAIDDAIAIVVRRRSDLVTVMGLFRVLIGDPNGYAATLVSEYGGNMDELQRRFSKG